MQASLEESEQISFPSLSSDFPNKFDQIFGDFNGKMKLDESDDDDEDVEDSDDEFSFACTGADGSPISADDVLEDGQFKTFFPLFDQSLIYAGDSNDFPRRPPVKKVFVETEDSAPPPENESSAAEADPAGPHCEWSRKAVEASPEVCKKSNSTGFSKFWRFRDHVNRSNSDGRDTFVFLNNGDSAPTSSKAAEVSEVPAVKKIATAVGGEVKADGGGVKVKAKRVKKTKTAALEQYIKNRREEDRKRSYLPYRPELVGFFTNVNGGLSRNVHPF